MSSSFWCLGIDPGGDGALAALRSDLSDLRIIPMPMLGKEVDTRQVRAFVEGVRAEGDVRHAVIEKAQVMPSQGAVAGFNYGVGYGALKAVLEMMGIPFEATHPAKWKKAVIGTAAASGAAATRSARKRQIKELAVLTAARLFPSVAFTKTQDGLAEAALLAEASRRTVLHGTMGEGSAPSRENRK